MARCSKWFEARRRDRGNPILPSPIESIIIRRNRHPCLVSRFDKSEARVFGSVVQAVFENGGADHKGGNIRLRFCASGPFVKENPREVSDGFKGFEITRKDRNRLYSEFAHGAQ